MLGSDLEPLRQRTFHFRSGLAPGATLWLPKRLPAAAPLTRSQDSREERAEGCADGGRVFRPRLNFVKWIGVKWI